MYGVHAMGTVHFISGFVVKIEGASLKSTSLRSTNDETEVKLE